jgi:hypothetical protein
MVDSIEEEFIRLVRENVAAAFAANGGQHLCSSMTEPMRSGVQSRLVLSRSSTSKTTVQISKVSFHTGSRPLSAGFEGDEAAAG